MARIMVFDSDPNNAYGRLDTAGNTVPYSGQLLSLSADQPTRTMAIRALSKGQDIAYVGWEFLVSATNLPLNWQIALRWWMEFYNDRLVTTAGAGGSQVVVPTQRNWIDVDPTNPWMRETCMVDSGGAGARGTRLLNMYGTERLVYFRARTNAVAGDPGAADSLYFPLAVHAAWARVGFYADTTLTTGASLTALQASSVHLRVFAHIGGHSEIQYLEQNGNLPYAYNAYG